MRAQVLLLNFREQERVYEALLVTFLNVYTSIKNGKFEIPSRYVTFFITETEAPDEVIVSSMQIVDQPTTTLRTAA